MRAALIQWIGDAEALRHINQFRVREIPFALGYQRTRKDDLYLALVGELFDRMRDGNAQPADWARLGNALAQYAVVDRVEELAEIGVAPNEAALYSASAFYFGGFPASAQITIKYITGRLDGDSNRACFDLFARPRNISSTLVRDLRAALMRGDLETILSIESRVSDLENSALQTGPDEWIPLHLLKYLLVRFRLTNLRAVLPDGWSVFWTPLIISLVNKGAWEFFPSQINAINRGLLVRGDTFSLQMPTGAGKTALCETLLFSHLNRNPGSAAVLLVPYRSLASELRNSLVKRLNEMGISARCAYGGTVPSGDEVRGFDETRALIATPETLSGILSANNAFAKRISLVICDEGHLLDARSRGISLELLLARMKIRDTGTQRFVFMSAIIPNIEEINSWLGGTEDTVVRSDYRPAVAEFSVLRQVGHGTLSPIDLEMHPHESVPIRYRIEGFLHPDDFQWVNLATGRMNTYPFSSLKTRAIAAARKSLSLGAAVVFTANKRGRQGAIGLANELLLQLEKNLQLPDPLEFANQDTVNQVANYFDNEYGTDWVGTRALRAGAVLHHGDIPQETREVVEQLLRDGHAKLGICTNTLAEGVNLPIRTLVLYSVQRLGQQGTRTNLLTRDIKNLVGRAGRAGSSTKGLVICVNESQWPMVKTVAMQTPVDPVKGALRLLIQRLGDQLAARNLRLTNDLLENSPVVHTLIDGIDSMLVDLAVLEIGEDEFLRMATSLADETFASREAEEDSKQLLRDVFNLRAQQIATIRAAGRLEWITETGAKMRMIDLVEAGLLPMRSEWDDLNDSLDMNFVNTILAWAWTHRDLQEAVNDAYHLGTEANPDSLQDSFFSVVRHWLLGESLFRISEGVNLFIDDILEIHSHVITYTLQTIVEQGIALLEKILQSRGQAISPAVVHFPEHLRFGVPSIAGYLLASGGVRHRRAFVTLGNAPELQGLQADDRSTAFAAALQIIENETVGWRSRLGSFVFENTLRDLSAFMHINN